MNLVKVDDIFKGKIGKNIFNLDIRLQKEMEFIENIKSKFPDKYNLEKMNYKNIQTPIEVKCNKHNIYFTQTPRGLLKGLNGCKMCYREKYNKGQDVFLKEAFLKHGDRYDYSLVKYIRTDIPVDIICSIHGVFQQRPKNHLSGQNCSKCVNGSKKKHETYNLKENTDTDKLKNTFIKKSINKYGHIYTYEKIIYRGLDIPVIITCPIHGDFEVTPHTHLRPTSNGCTKCHNNRLERKLSYIEKATKLHGDIFDYSNLDLNLERNIFYCKEHGNTFEQELRNHLLYNGCPECIRKKHSMSEEDFLRRGISIHGDKYTYNKTKLVKLDIPVTITCPIHGDFSKLPYDFIRPSNSDNKNGCPVCTSSSGEKEVFDILNGLEIEFTREYKIPNFNYRYDFFIPYINVLIEFHGEQHYQEHFFNTIQNNDTEKMELAKIKKYNLLVLDYKNKELRKTIIDYLRFFVRYKSGRKVFFTKEKLLEMLGTGEDYKKYRFNLTI